MQKDYDFQNFLQDFSKIPPEIVEKALKNFLDNHPEILENVLYKNNFVFQKVVERLSYSNIATKDDIKMLLEFMNKRFEDVNKRFEDMNKRFEDMNKRFEELREDMNKRFDFLLKVIIGFNVPILLCLFSILLKFLFSIPGG
jgi:hypothetical protein